MHATLPESFKLILDHGVDPDVVGGGGYTTCITWRRHMSTTSTASPGRRCCSMPARRSTQARSAAQVDAARLGLPLGPHRPRRLYLERGADAVETDAEPWATPLAWATKGGHHEIVELLRSRGAR